MGDQWDMPSLSSYDKGLRSFQGRTYSADIASGLEFSDRLWSPVRKTKKKLPLRVYLEGNHEHRIVKALDLSPELVGTISLRDLDLSSNYDIVVPYTGKSTPGVIELDGIYFAHYMVSGVQGRPLSSEHSGHALITKTGTSCIVAHSHLLDYCVRTRPNGDKYMGLASGCFVDYPMDWPGETQKMWNVGVCVLHNVERGAYDLEWISLKRLEREYGTR
jgi:hypothetical protein